MSVEVDKEEWDKQQDYLLLLRRMSRSQLIKEHKRVFAKAPKRWQQPSGKWLPAFVLQRRLWYVFCARHYHVKDQVAVDAFRRKADKILSHIYKKGESEYLYDIAEENQKFRDYTLEGILKMDQQRVEQICLKLGYIIDAPEKNKKMLLYELIRSQPGDAIPRFNMDGKMVKRRLNRYVLQDIILENPTMNWRQFQEEWGPDMPNTTHLSFRECKSRLRRKYGTDVIPYTHYKYVQAELLDAAYHSRGLKREKPYGFSAEHRRETQRAKMRRLHSTGIQGSISRRKKEFGGLPSVFDGATERVQETIRETGED